MRRTISFIMAMLMLISAISFTACSNVDATKDLEKIKEDGVLKVGMECNYAPFNWTQATKSETSVPISNSSGYADGYDVQIAKKVADALGVKLEIVKLEWKGLVPALQSGKIDMVIAGMSPTEERKKTIDFSDEYYTSELVVVIKKGSEYENATSINDFSGAEITGQQDTFHYSVIDQMQGVTKKTALADFSTMIVSLQNGAIDGYISELPGAVSAVESNRDLTYVSFESGKGFEASPEDVAIAVGVRKGSSLTEEINKVLATVTKEDRADLMDFAIANQPVVEE